MSESLKILIVDDEPLNLDVLAQGFERAGLESISAANGHEALKESTLTTFRAFAPYHPLPADFPEPTLKLRVKVIYPQLRRSER